MGEVQIDSVVMTNYDNDTRRSRSNFSQRRESIRHRKFTTTSGDKEFTPAPAHAEVYAAAWHSSPT